MARIVFRLNHVPEPEADAVRELLAEHGFDYYETHEGRWGLSVAAIWLKHDEDFERARELIDKFQATHSTAMRDEFEQAKRDGKIPTFWQLLKSSPLLFIAYWGLIIAVALLTVVPMFQFFL
ncbi:DUF6164 family protein [Reinekea blandensis]|uniref:DUF2007 domain-containing protein n=1 Tax=Reinekea blandensis MED297 TaxID=314283 RepID=A4BB71_9GAMM|nr:DUF6164 family protein [Reinekea blandensis]EAR10684.1 hypothetical protein MED297_11730 [Reinekea sp. MED297] [Reinekea blandensis MED297]